MQAQGQATLPTRALVIDPPNLAGGFSETCHTQQIPPLHKLIWPFMGGQCDLVWSVACLACRPDCVDDWGPQLRELGVEVWERLVNRKGTGQLGKTNCDAEIGFALAEAGARADQIVLFSGDSDFTPSVRRLVQRGKQVYVVSFTGAASRGLQAAATGFVAAERILQAAELAGRAQAMAIGRDVFRKSSVAVKSRRMSVR